jgi:hypothetical protein
MALIHVCFLLWLDILFVWLPYVSLKFFFCNHIHMSFVIYNTKTYFFMRVLFRTLCSLCNKTNCFHGIKCGRKGIYLIDFQMCHEFFDC